MSDEQHVCRNRDLKIVAAPLEDLIYSLRTIIYGMHDCYFEQKFVKAVEKFSDLCVCVCVQAMAHMNVTVPGCMTFLADSLQPLMFITSFICGKELIIAHAAWSGDFRGTNK